MIFSEQPGDRGSLFLTIIVLMVLFAALHYAGIDMCPGNPDSKECLITQP